MAVIDVGKPTAAVLYVSIPNTHQQLDWVIDDDLPVVRGDAMLLAQAWANLLDNAVKFTRKVAHPVITIGWQRSDDGSRTFHVEDNGVGFDTKYAQKLFGVFQRLHRASEFEGTGIGLALVRRIVEHHGGRIWAHAQPDQGSTFHVFLPSQLGHDAPEATQGRTDRLHHLPG